MGCKRSPSPADLQVVQDLGATSFVAELQTEEALIDFGTQKARPHMIRGWSFDEKRDPRSFVWSNGRSSVLEFFLSYPRRTKISFQCLPFKKSGARPQTVTVFANGQIVDTIELSPGWSEYHLTLPSHALVGGINELELRYGYTGVPEAQIGVVADPQLLAVAWDYIRFEDIGEETPSFPALSENGILRVPSGSRLDYFVDLPIQSYVTLDDIALPENRDCVLTIAVQSAGERERILAKLRRRVRSHVIPTNLKTRRFARVSFLAACPDMSTGSQVTIDLTNPAIRIAKARGEEPSPPPAGAQLEIPKKPNVILYVVDALRPDHLGCYGYPRPTSPNVDKFARDSVIFRRALAQSPWTKASVASILTGLTPPRHRVQDQNDVLSAKAETLAELLAASGYRTTSFVANGWIGEEFGFTQGFQETLYIPSEPSSRVHEGFLSWLDKSSLDTPFFAYLHTVDPHSPYEPPSEFREQFSRGEIPKNMGSLPLLKKLHHKKMPVSRTVIQNLVDLYDAEIAFNDFHFGTLVRELKRRRLYDETMVIFTSDHGEAFNEHGKLEHGANLFSEVLNVPLIIKMPIEGKPTRQEVEIPVQQVDILPTILDTIGADQLGVSEGRSLRPLLKGQKVKGWDRRIFSYLKLRGMRSESVTFKSWKLIRRWTSDEMHLLKLYNHEGVPEDQTNVAHRHPIETKYLLSQIELHQTVASHLEGRKTTIDEDLRRSLRALGYLQ